MAVRTQTTTVTQQTPVVFQLAYSEAQRAHAIQKKLQENLRDLREELRAFQQTLARTDASFTSLFAETSEQLQTLTRDIEARLSNVQTEYNNLKDSYEEKKQQELQKLLELEDLIESAFATNRQNRQKEIQNRSELTALTKRLDNLFADFKKQEKPIPFIKDAHHNLMARWKFMMAYMHPDLPIGPIGKLK